VISLKSPARCGPTAALAMNLSTDVIQEVTELNLSVHDDHMESSRRRQRPAYADRAPISEVALHYNFTSP